MLPALRYRAFVVGKRTECIFLNVYSCGFYVGFLARLITHAYLRRGLCSAKSIASFYFILLQAILVTQQDAKLTVRDSPQAIDSGCVFITAKAALNSSLSFLSIARIVQYHE